ncbi:hypothetical protein [Pseudovibrio sp. POLY-S9]|uniref:hypothetical protein n=1 Tax=Pseudovibrio sp. POLY-S9 TaxID=1576596 RepID=UPI000710AD2C|nr:hypothetical protein [Pseudovibrio sp. POLY-S9]
MTKIFEIDGSNLELGFKNIQSPKSRIEQEMHELIECMWKTYEPYADPDFREGFARDVDGRFWEMYIGCSLLEAGHTLLPVSEREKEGGQPDICVLENGRRIWIEAIAPDDGQVGPDQIERPVPLNEGGKLIAVPVRQAQLRTTSAFWTKAQKIERYLAEGVIQPEDTRIIAISASRFSVCVSEDPPLILTSLFPLGDRYVTLDRVTGKILEEGYTDAPMIKRAGGVTPRTAFMDKQFAHISGVLWSRIGLGNLSRKVRPLHFVHNPLAEVSFPPNWDVWDNEFVATIGKDYFEIKNTHKMIEPADQSD